MAGALPAQHTCPCSASLVKSTVPPTDVAAYLRRPRNSRAMRVFAAPAARQCASRACRSWIQPPAGIVMAMIVAVMGGLLHAAHKHTGACPSALNRILLPPACAYRAYLKHVGNKPSVGSGAQKNNTPSRRSCSRDSLLTPARQLEAGRRKERICLRAFCAGGGRERRNTFALRLCVNTSACTDAWTNETAKETFGQ